MVAATEEIPMSIVAFMLTPALNLRVSWNPAAKLPPPSAEPVRVLGYLTNIVTYSRHHGL